MCGCLLHAPYWGPGTQPRHVSLTGNPTGDPLVHRPALNPLSHTSQGWKVYLISEVTDVILRKCSLDGLDSLSKGGTTTPWGKGEGWAGIEKRSSCLQNRHKAGKAPCCGSVNELLSIIMLSRASWVRNVYTGNGTISMVIQLSWALLRRPEAGSKKTDYWSIARGLERGWGG